MSLAAFSSSLSMSLTTALVVSVCVVDSMVIAYDGSVMGSINVLSSYLDYFSLTTATIAVNTTAVFLGAILVVPFTGWVMDVRGRKPAIALSAFLNILGAAISGAAQNIAMFIAGRMIVGLGMGLAQGSASAYVSETTAPHVRSFALGMYFTCWSLGSFLATGICYGTANLNPSTWAWRIPCILQGAVPAILLLIMPLLPESPRWLAHNDRPAEALSVLARINGLPEESAEVQMQMTQILATMEYEKTTGAQLGFLEIFRTAENRRRLGLAVSVAPLAMLTGSNVITYYYGTMLSQAGITSSKKQMEINMVLSAFQFFVGIAGSLLSDKIGRRMLCLMSLGSATAMLYLVGGLTAAYGTSSDQSGVYGTVASVFLFLGCYSFGITPLTSMYPAEVLSYNMRGTGMAMFVFWARVCGIFVTEVFPYMFNAIGWKTYMVNASWNVLFWVLVFVFWVETKGRTLEEIDEIFDPAKAEAVREACEKNSDISVAVKDA